MKNLILPPPGSDGINFDPSIKKYRRGPGIPLLPPMLFAVFLLLVCFLPHTALAQGACGEWTQTAIGSPSSGSAQFDACAPGTITITSAGAGSNTADRQYMVQRELCGDGTIDVKIESISNGRAGLEIRADNAAGSVKAGIETALTPFIFRVFRTATDAAQSQQQATASGHRWLRLVRSGSNIQLFWSSTGVNWTSAALYTNMALPPCARIGIFVESNNASVATGVFSNLSVISTDTPPTTFSFAAANLSAAAGQSVQVCVNAANPCACAPASVQVALQGNAAPHLSGFSTQTLQFQSGDTQKCFSLSTAAAPGDGAYTLILQNPTGGNAAAIGAQSALAVAVTGEPVTPTGCPWAGPDREICRGDTITIGCIPPDSLNGLCFYWWPQENMEQPSSAQTQVWPDEDTQYVVYVTDDQGRLHGIDTVTITVLQPGALRISPNPSYLCNGAPDTLRTSGNFATYLWSSGQTSADIVVSTPGTYRVTATSAEGCEVVDSVVVQTFDFQTQLTPQNPVFCQDSIKFTATSNAHTVGWYVEGELMTYSNEFVMHWIAPVEAVFYGPGGCREVRHIEFSRAIPDILVFPAQPVICFDDTLTLTAAPGFATYRWYDDEGGSILSNTPSVQVTQPMIHYIEVTDANGCVFGKDVEINYAPAIDSEVAVDFTSICFQEPGFVPPPGVSRPKSTQQQCAALAALDAGEGFVTYNWSNGASGRNIQVDEPGEYAVTLTDASGCTFSPRPVVVAPCTDPPFAFTPGTAPVISCTTPAKLSPGAGFAHYSWSDGSTLDTLTTTLPGLYTITVTDFNGCQAVQKYQLDIADANATVDLEIYKPAALAGNTTTLVVDEDAVGAMTFVNADNDDRDKVFDIDDKDVVNGDNDLMKIRLKLDPAGMTTRSVTLRALSGGNTVKIWKSNTKKAGEYILGTPVDLTQPDGSFFVLDLWVEGVKAHTRQRETVLVLECAGAQASQCLQSDSVSITIIGLKELAWKGRNNGFDGGANQSNTLDTADPNFPGNLRNTDNSPLRSYRVFPDMRIINGTVFPPILTPLRDTVELCVVLSAPPTETFHLYLKTFDVDDPSANNKPVDPNDKTKNPGIYDATATNTTYAFGPPLTYDKDHDNRGTIFQAPAAPCPFGLLEGDTNFDGMVSLNFQPGDTLKTLWFKTSLHPGDNYRVAAVFDSLMLPRLQNEDAKHGIHIHDKDAGRVVLDANMVSPVLTVWRLFNLEVASMANLTGNNNKVKTFIYDFDGGNNLASRTTRLYVNLAIPMDTFNTTANPLTPILQYSNLRDLEQHFPNVMDNPPSADLNSSPPANGRFENGFFTLGINGTLEGEIRNNGINFLNVKALQSGAASLPGLQMDLILIPVPGDTITGLVQEIQKSANGTFTFTVVLLNRTLQGVPNSAVFIVSDGQPMNIAAINTTNNTITTNNLSLTAMLRDDDRVASNQILPYNLAQDAAGFLPALDTFKSVYLEPIVLPSHVLIPFFPTISAPNYKIRVESQFDYIKIDLASNTSTGIWYGATCFAWQSGKWNRDNDPKEDTLNLGLTFGPVDNLSIVAGGDISVFPFETFYDAIGSLNNPTESAAISFIHEIGHQFGLAHIIEMELMHEELRHNNTGFNPRHKNIIRSRRRSPGR